MVFRKDRKDDDMRQAKMDKQIAAVLDAVLGIRDELRSSVIAPAQQAEQEAKEQQARKDSGIEQYVAVRDRLLRRLQDAEYDDTGNLVEQLEKVEALIGQARSRCYFDMKPKADPFYESLYRMAR